MRPWAPLSLTRTGRPIIGQVPVRTVVYDGPMTPHQSAMLQNVFTGFMDMARQSIASNPSAQGLLPDGSKYVIHCVGGACTCSVWVSEEEVYLGGIGLALTYLDGTPLPDHTDKDGSAQTYVLTPELKDRGRKGTRFNTGKWKVRKAYYNGGKSVHYHAQQKRWVTAVPGRFTDSSLSSSGGGACLANQRAYKYSDLGPSNNVVVKNEIVGKMGRGEFEIGRTPFYSKRLDNKLWLLQLVPRYDFSFSPARTFIDVYGEASTPPPNSLSPIGELISTFSFPVGYGIRPQTLDINADGTMVRLMATTPTGGYQMAHMELRVNDGTLSVSSIREVGTRVVDVVTPNNHDTGIGTTFETRYRSGSTVGGTTTSGDGFGYDGKGRPVLVESGHKNASGSHSSTTTTARNWVPPADPVTNPRPLVYINTENVSSTSSTTYANSWVSVNGTEISVPAGSRTDSVSSTKVMTNSEFEGSGSLDKLEFSGVRTIRQTSKGAVVLYVDPTTKLAIYEVHVIVGAYDGTGFARSRTTPGTGWDHGFDPPMPFGVPVVEEYTEIIVECRGRTLLSERVEERPAGFPRYAHRISAASDPRTGAVCVNLLQVAGTSSVVAVKSWIFLADDQGGKHLHEVMKNLPAGANNIRVKYDAMLLSV